MFITISGFYLLCQRLFLFTCTCFGLRYASPVTVRFWFNFFFLLLNYKEILFLFNSCGVKRCWCGMEGLVICLAWLFVFGLGDLILFWMVQLFALCWFVYLGWTFGFHVVLLFAQWAIIIYSFTGFFFFEYLIGKNNLNNKWILINFFSIILINEY